MKLLFKFAFCLAASLSATTLSATELAASQDEFFNAIKQHCGKAYQGKVVIDTHPSPSFQKEPLVMHVRQCTNEQLHIPFHIADDASRTWILTKQPSRLHFTHDHRKPDGSEDPLSWYGGHTITNGTSTEQTFPVDEKTKAMFTHHGLTASLTNTWIVSINENTFTYKLIRPNREFVVEFNLSKPITPPSAPWGY